MNEYNKDIGNRIKELRELSDISMQDMAEELNVDIETYSQYESWEVDIPASFIYEIANQFQVDLSLLLTGEESRMSIFDVTRANKGISVERRKEYNHHIDLLFVPYEKREYFLFLNKEIHVFY